MILKTRQDAKTLAKALVEGNPKLPRRYLLQRSEDKPCIQIVNTPQCSIILAYVETDEETLFTSYKIAEINTVTGRTTFSWWGFSDIANRLFRCREYINQSGQIKGIVLGVTKDGN